MRNSDKSKQKKEKSEEFSPIVFVNNPISQSDDDVIDFSSQVNTIKTAINNGAKMIGIIADYGTGKSSMSELLKSEIKKDGNPEPIKINMWDCLCQVTKKTDTSESVSNLTKSFLYQLSNGRSRRFASYINKLLSKNYGNISFAANNILWFFIWIVLSAISYTVYKILGLSGTGVMQYLPQWCEKVASFAKLGAPLFVLLALVFLAIGIKNVCITFSHWKMPQRREPEINDVYDTYGLIIDKLTPKKGRYQLVFIDDLDRIDEKGIIIEFLKELYRFQDSLGDKSDKFVFVISIKPESELTNSQYQMTKSDEYKNDKIYTKVFDTVISLKPIHFDDYDSILLRLIRTDESKKENLIKLIGNADFEKSLPESFKWIKKGTNLTLRDLKDRLNHAVAILISLKNKSYKVGTSESFEPCAAVAYLENQYPKDYYILIKNEESFAGFMKRSYKIINEEGKGSATEKLYDLFIENFKANSCSDDFVKDFCSMVADRLFNDDFRMYFYTYPKDSHIKTTEERELCDMLLFPNQNDNYDELEDNIKKAYSRGNNEVVSSTLVSLESFPQVVIMNDTLFVHAVSVSLSKTFNIFASTVVDVIESEKNMVPFWRRIKQLPDKERSLFVKKCIDRLISTGSVDNIVRARLDITQGFGESIEEFSELFLGCDEILPQISQEEIEAINNPYIATKLINIEKVDKDQFDYLSSLIISCPLITEKVAYDLAYKTMCAFAEVLSAEDLAEQLLSFLSINHICDNDFFYIVCEGCNYLERITEYINSFVPSDFSDEYMEMIDALGIDININESLVNHLMEKHLFFTALTYLIAHNQLESINAYLEYETEILCACRKICVLSEEKLISLRIHFCFVNKNKNYFCLFEDDFPLITEEEFGLVDNPKEAIDLINANKVTINNCLHLLGVIYSRNYSEEEIVYLFEHLFDDETNNCVLDKDVKKEFVDNFDFEKVSLKKLDSEQRSRIFKLIKNECQINNADDAIEFSNRLGCFVPEIERIIRSANSKVKEYLNLISSIDELTEVALEWIENSGKYVTVGLSENLCKVLYDNGFLLDYIVADTLRKGYLNIDASIPFSEYINVYNDVEELFLIMSGHWVFLERLQQEAALDELDDEHLIPIFKTEQTKRFFEFIFSDKTSASIKQRYLVEFGKFKTEEDSKAFQMLICKEDNMKLLGSYDIYHRIHENLWSSNPSHKMLFTRTWNKNWKDKLNKT